MVDYTLDPESENKFSSYADKLSSMQGDYIPETASGDKTPTINYQQAAQTATSGTSSAANTEKTAGEGLMATGGAVAMANPYVGVPMMVAGAGLTAYGSAKESAYQAKLKKLSMQQQAITSMMRNGSVL